ncbi:SusC/RagA family TonB-linked outer membrane protein [Belliella marina]|uniref:SusC/RagA family TonB-linked outer membrane protein n=1 Tax=Belliella marina TaxID=1644146 RepID=A0ABW4VUR9_9BACT
MVRDLLNWPKRFDVIKMTFVFLCFAASVGAVAQVTVTGTVTDGTENLPLPGVTVIEKGTAHVVVTDIDGKYSLNVSNGDASLVFSFIGFETVTLPLQGRTSLDVTLQPEETMLEQVIVVGYGTQKKVNISGAVDQISGEQLVNRPVANVMQGLQGASPGLNITYSGGRPGSVPDINIRGFTSINGGGPLIVIDGIASSNEDLLRLSPSDIASFTVLRDASSAAIYGARAAFGVVLITTKEGTGGKQTMSYNSTFTWGRPTVLPRPVTDPYIYSRVMDQATSNTPWNYINYSDDHYTWAKERSENPSIEDVRIDPNDPNRWAYMGNNDWYDYFFNSSSFSTNQSLAISGSTDSGNLPVGYYLSADYTRENGMNKLAPDHWDRYALRARINVSPKKWLKVDNNLNLYQTERADPTTNITDIYYLRPLDVATNPDGSWANTDAGRLAARLTEGGRNNENMFGFHNILRGIGTFLNGDLSVTGNVSVKREQWKYGWDRRKFDIGFGPEDIRTEGGDGFVAERNGYLTNTILDLYSNYNKKLGEHSIGLLGGFNQEDYIYSSVESERRVLISSSLPYLGLTTGDNFVRPGYSSYATRSLFGRASYNYKGKYIAEFNGRYDGSSRFPSTNRWGFFPSVSGAWIMSDESFFSGLTNIVSMFKIRASYGSLGNQNVSNFGYIQALPTGLSSHLIGGERQTIITSAPPLAVDPNFYTWERVITTNFGLDVGILEDKIFASMDYFIRDTKDMLTNPVELPGVLGTSAPLQNAADLQTKGWELSVTYRDHFNTGSGPVQLSTRFFLSDSRSWITKFENEQQLLSNWRVGQEVGEIWGLSSNGYFQNYDEINQLDQSAIVPWGALDVVPGWPKYMDLDGDGKIERGQTATDPKDLSVIGNSRPRYHFGANIDVSWKGLDLSIFLQGVGRQDYYPRHYLFWGPYQQPYANIYPWNLDFYRAEADNDQMRALHSASYIAAGLADANTDSSYPVLQSWLADANYGGGLDIPQTKYLLNAAYMRVKNLSIGYSLPEVWTQKLKVSRARFFVSGENLYEFSAIKKFVDPESVNNGFGWSYPFQRRYAVGVNIDF